MRVGGLMVVRNLEVKLCGEKMRGGLGSLLVFYG